MALHDRRELAVDELHALAQRVEHLRARGLIVRGRGRGGECAAEIVGERQGVARERRAAIFARIGHLVLGAAALVLFLGKLALGAVLEHRELGGALGELGGERRETRLQLAARHAGIGRRRRLGGNRIGTRIVGRRLRGAVRGLLVFFGLRHSYSYLPSSRPTTCAV